MAPNEPTNQTLNTNTPETEPQHKSWWPLWLLGSLILLFLIIVIIFRGLCTDVWYINLLKLNDNLCNGQSSLQQNLSLKDGSIKGPEIASGAIAVNQLAPSLQTTINNIASPVPGPQGPTGSSGTRGSTGSIGVTGPQGPQGIAGPAEPITSNILSSAGNNLDSTVNGVGSNVVSIINSNTATLTQAGGLTSTVNGVVANQAIGSDTATQLLGYNGAGNAVYQSVAGILAGNTTNSLTLLGTSLTSTVNGVADSEDLASLSASLSCAPTNNFICQNGNSLGTTITIGSNDANSVGLETGGITYYTLNTSGLLRGSNSASISVPGAGINSERFGFGALAGGTNATALGNGAVASGVDSVAIGRNSTASAVGGSVAIGVSSQATGSNNIAIGESSAASSLDSISIGVGSSSTAAGSIAFGLNATTSGPSSVAIGGGANCANWYCIGIGANSTALQSGVAVGANSASSSLGLAIGDSSVSSGQGSISIGYGAISANISMAIGTGANSASYRSIAFGSGSSTSGNQSIAIGYDTGVTGTSSVAIGYNQDLTGSNTVAIGYLNNVSNNNNGVVVGYNNTTSPSGGYAIAVGRDNTCLNACFGAFNSVSDLGAVNRTTIGFNNTVSQSTNSITAGSFNTMSSGTSAQIFGVSNDYTGNGSNGFGGIFGHNNTIDGSGVNTGVGSYAVGTGNSILVTSASDGDAFAFGRNNNILAPGGIAVGDTNTVGAQNGISLGMNNSSTSANSNAISIGQGNIHIQNRDNFTLIGFNNTAGGANSEYGVALGYNNTAGDRGASIGISNISGGARNYLYGNNNTPDREDSYIFGNANTGSGTNGSGSAAIFGFRNNLVQNAVQAEDFVIGSDNNITINTSNNVNYVFGESNTMNHTITNGNGYIVGRNSSITATGGSEDVAFVVGNGITNATASTLQIGMSNAGKVTITSGGSVDIGAATTPTHKLTVTDTTDNNVARFNGNTGQCTVDAGVGWSCTSDISLKSNVLDMNVVGSLAKLGALKPVTYQWKGDYDQWVADGSIPGDEPGTQYGFVAQDMETVLPEAVETDPITGLKMINYGKLNTFMIAALKENYGLISNFQNTFTFPDASTVQTNRKLLADGGIEVNGTTELNGATTVNALLTLNGAVQFNGTANFDGVVNVNGRMQLGNSNTGTATVAAGGTSVYVPFPTAFSAVPSVGLTPTASITDNYWASGITTAGFTVNLNSVQAGNATFNWQAF